MNNKPKTLIVSPHFHPMQDGLGQYTKKFFETLSQYHQVGVLTSTCNTEAQTEYENIFPTIKNWRLDELFDFLKTVNEFKPDTVLIQYVPFMYAKRGGINFSILVYFLALHLLRKTQVNIMYHELHYPLEANLKAIIMWFCHHVMLFFSINCADVAFCSVEKNIPKLRRLKLFNKAKIFPLYVGSNIDFTPHEPLERHYLTLFGTFHVSKQVESILTALLEYTSQCKNGLKVLYIGAAREKVLSLLTQEQRERFSPYLETPGFLPEVEVSNYLSQTKALVAFFVDGLTTRRGSAIAAIQHGAMLVSSQSQSTSDIFKNRPDCYLLSNDPDEFKRLLPDALNDITQKRSSSSKNNQDLFEKYFSWQQIVQEYISKSNNQAF